MQGSDYKKIEEKILKFWADRNIFARSLEQRAGKKRFVFFEGPPTANGRPGSHHVLSRVFKDVFPRYLAVNGDEGEPSTFKDHMLVEGDPHQLIEGVIITAFAIQAHHAFIYLRGEYRYLLESLRAVMKAKNFMRSVYQPRQTGPARRISACRRQMLTT